MTANAEPGENLTVALPIQRLELQADLLKAKELIVQPQPIRLTVDTSTDWPSVFATSFVGLTGALVALSVGYMALIGQRNQIRALRANFRHDWQRELKQLIGKIIVTSVRMKYELENDQDYLKKPDSNELFCNLVEAQVGIEVMLDRAKEYTHEIIEIVESLVNAAKASDGDELDKMANKLIIDSNKLVEQVWRDIRNDLDGKTRNS